MKWRKVALILFVELRYFCSYHLLGFTAFHPTYGRLRDRTLKVELFAWSVRLCTWNVELFTSNTELFTRNVRLWTWNAEFWTRSVGLFTRLKLILEKSLSSITFQQFFNIHDNVLNFRTPNLTLLRYFYSWGCMKFIGTVLRTNLWVRESLGFNVIK